MAAADGFRLSVSHAHLEMPVAEPFSVIIPANSLKELNRISADLEDPISLTLPPGRGQSIFHMSDIDLVSQLIDGIFPDFNQIIPQSHTTRTVVSAAEMQAACKAADIIAREAVSYTHLTLPTTPYV